ncbi:MAG: hypothetical protein A2138_19775 [Deltaproteobacteria bacterium RBG_16_71_12]|nr:MAG: hypothetical protein A2138_19775 [Deltaproteobacteria bacterium RBG_16_71_12]
MLPDMVTMNISLDEQAVEKLRAIAAKLDKPVEDLVAELVQGTLSEEERYRVAVREGIAQADAGRLVDLDDAFDRVTEKLKRMHAGQR